MQMMVMRIQFYLHEAVHHRRRDAFGPSRFTRDYCNSITMMTIKYLSRRQPDFTLPFLCSSPAALTLGSRRVYGMLMCCDKAAIRGRLMCACGLPQTSWLLRRRTSILQETNRKAELNSSSDVQEMGVN